jgi:hypothetical protein
MPFVFVLPGRRHSQGLCVAILAERRCVQGAEERTPQAGEFMHFFSK